MTSGAVLPFPRECVKLLVFYYLHIELLPNLILTVQGIVGYNNNNNNNNNNIIDS
jgi:hypothetical protein